MKKKVNKGNQQKKERMKEQKSVRHQVGHHEGLLLEILSRLPVKSLVRFKCVCKQWESIIQKDDFFIDLHFSRSKAAMRTYSILHVSELVTTRTMRLLSAELFLPSKEEDGSVHLRNTCSWRAWRQYHLRQHCICTLDGLVCFIDHGNGFARIYNISTRESTPWIKTTTKKAGFRRLMVLEFGYDQAKKEYKVLALWNLSENYYNYVSENSYNNVVVFEVLTVRQNSWRQIDGIPSITPHDTVSSVCLNGSIYMLCTNNSHYDNNPPTQTIVEFNVGSEKFRIVETTSYIYDRSKAYLMELDGRLCVLSYDTQDETCKSIKMRTLYDHSEAVQDKKSKTMTSNNSSTAMSVAGSSNFDWGQAETLSFPHHIKLHSIRHIPGTKLFISINDGYLYYYIWNHKSSKVNFEISSLLGDQTDQHYCLGFGTFTPNLFHVN
ncbi:hypothetical protein MKW92_048151 [Papaver armeniacum]|nr:hypothetical protein MKW92_048151 [Papaver armeniacum]